MSKWKCEAAKMTRVSLVGVGRWWWKRCLFSLEWNSEGVMDDESGHGDVDKGEED